MEAMRCSSPERFDPIGLAYGAIAACFQRRVDFGRRQQMDLAGVGGDQEGPGSRGFDVSQFLLDIVRNVGKPRSFVGERDHQGMLGAGDEIDVGAGRAHGAVHAQPIADPGRPEDAWQRRARADRMRDRNVARLRENEALAGVAIRRRRVEPRTRPGASESEDIDHELEVANRWIACSHGAAADGLDRGDAAIASGLRYLTRAQLTGVGRTRWYQIRQEFWKLSGKIDVVAQQPKATGRGRAPDDRPGRSADDEIGRLVGYARAAEPVSEPEQPGNEVFAASAEHEGAVLADPERRSSGKWYGRMSIGAGVRLRVARGGFARCATEREESGSSREQHLPPVQGEPVIRVFGGPLHRRREM